MIFQNNSENYLGIVYGNLVAIKLLNLPLSPQAVESKFYLDINISITKYRTLLGISQQQLPSITKYHFFLDEEIANLGIVDYSKPMKVSMKIGDFAFSSIGFTKFAKINFTPLLLRINDGSSIFTKNWYNMANEMGSGKCQHLAITGPGFC